jgi:hypothetical protein
MQLVQGTQIFKAYVWVPLWRMNQKRESMVKARRQKHLEYLINRTHMLGQTGGMGKNEAQKKKEPK